MHVPRGQLEFSIEGRLPTRTRTSPSTAPAAHEAPLPRRPFRISAITDVVSMSGGFNKWKDEGLTWTTPRTMTQDQRMRYQRHLLLPEVGEKGQMKLLDSKVLAARRGWPRISGRHLSRGRGCGNHRHHRHGRGRLVEPAAPDPSHGRPRRDAQGRQREGSHHGD